MQFDVDTLYLYGFLLFFHLSPFSETITITIMIITVEVVAALAAETSISCIHQLF